ncbi:hypothetical protein STXM2123_4811 [Streptomyces sp. F-3]|nr:hypothetical protein STXM2123_4811 [Streptomyces sp. F-3]
MITVPALPAGTTQRHHIPRWTASASGNRYSLSQTRDHPTTADAAEESPG